MSRKKHHKFKVNTYKILFFTFLFGFVGCNWVNEGKSGMQLIYEGYFKNVDHWAINLVGKNVTMRLYVLYGPSWLL
jgi:hypothetical protein